MKIIHIINSLKKGGAEGNLFRLCEFQKKKYKNKIDITIITLIDNGFYKSDLKKMGIRVFSLKINLQRKFFDFISKIIELRKFIKKKKSQYHSKLDVPFKFYYFIHSKIFL